MAFKEEIVDFFQTTSFFDMSLNQLIIRIIIAVLLIIIGIIIGRLMKRGVSRLLKDAKLGIGESFFRVLAAVIEISIYILFINFALSQLGISALTNWLSSILIIIPAFTGALILIGLGFAVGVYLRSVIEDSNVVGKKVLSLIFFYFVVYISLVYALKSALVSLDKSTVNIIILILTGVVGAGIAYNTVRQSHVKK